MSKIDETVKKETTYIAVWMFILSMLMQAVFLFTGYWNRTVLFGNLLGYLGAILNFFLMGIGIQQAVQKSEQDAKTAMKMSRIYRNLFLLIILVLGVVLPCFHTWAAIIPLFFPRIAIAFRPMWDKRRN